MELRHDAEEAPWIRDPLQPVLAAVLEVDPRAGDEVLDGARDEHLAGLGKRRHARADVHGDAADLAVDELALTRVQPCADVQVERADAVADRARAADRPRRSVERREEAVAGR